VIQLLPVAGMKYKLVFPFLFFWNRGIDLFS